MRVRSKKIILKNGSILDDYVQQRDGVIIRYRYGKTALMRIHKIEEDSHGFRIEGMNILGDSHSAYAHDCILANDLDRKTWQSYWDDRAGCFLNER